MGFLNGMSGAVQILVTLLLLVALDSLLEQCFAVSDSPLHL